jgi:hypothetical protein
LIFKPILAQEGTQGQAFVNFEAKECSVRRLEQHFNKVLLHQKK